VEIESNAAKDLAVKLLESRKFDTAEQMSEAMREVFKELIQIKLEGEMDEMLGYQKNSAEGNNTGNSRNGYTKKSLRTPYGKVAVKIPRDRNGEFKPRIIPKNVRSVAGVDEKIMGLYSAGMSTRDIAEQVSALYGISVSAGHVSDVTNAVMPEVHEWNARPLERAYAFIFLDAINYKVHEDRQVRNRAAYIALGVNLDGVKEVLGIWLGQNESSKFWLGVLGDLKGRGVSTVLVFCVDGLTGFKEAITAAYPESRIQRCVIHLIRSSAAYIAAKDKKGFMSDLKLVYGAASQASAEAALGSLEARWGGKYPHAVKEWSESWDCVTAMFEFPDFIRRVMYTTNAVESLNSGFRKLTGKRMAFPNDDSLLKMLYLAVTRIAGKWTRRYPNWDLAVNWLNIIFEDQLKKLGKA
jgi:transposase-like protein